MLIESPVIEQHQPIPKKYSCEGENISPALTFRDIPKGAKSLALIMDDPDAPNGTWVHWVIWDLDPNSKILPEKAQVSKVGKNSFHKMGYGGPCPPPGAPHRYFFKLYALDRTLDLPSGATKEQLEEAMEGHIIGKSELIGTYQRT